MITKEDKTNKLFNFTVETCWATAGKNPNPEDATAKDVFFDEQCNIDRTVTFEHSATETNNFFKYAK